MKPYDPQGLFKEQSTKSLSKYRSESIEQRALRIGKELLVPSFPRKKESINVFTITTNASHHSQKSRDGRTEEQLQRKVRMLEYELKRKLNEDSILRNIFKTRQTHEMNHVDLYLELRNLEDKYNELSKHELESRRTASQYEQLLKDQEEQHLKNMEEFNGCISEKQKQWVQEKQRLSEDAEKYRMQFEEGQFLIEELKKKNSQLLKKNKQLVEELSIEKESRTLQFIKLKADYQRQTQELQQTLAKLTSELAHISQQSAYYSQEKDALLRQLDEAKDHNEKLQLQVCELEEASREVVSKEQQLRKQQREKYADYYEKLRQEHQVEIERIIRQQEEEVNNLKKESAALAELNVALKESVKKLERQVVEMNRELENRHRTIKQLEQEQGSLRSQHEKEIEINAKLSRQAKQFKFQHQQMQQQLQRARFELKDQSKAEEKLQAKLKALEEQNERLQQKAEQLKMAAENSQAYRKLNDKIYNQKYKTLGRLIEICNKIKQHIEETAKGEAEAEDLLAKAANEESLSDAVSLLADLLSYVLRSSQSLRREKEDLTRQRNIENRQICSILEHCKNTLHNEECLSLLARYVALLRQRKMLSREECKERVDIYHQLIQSLISLHSAQYYSSDQSKPTYVRDSLESTYLLKEYQSKKKESKGIERQSSCKHILKKNRIETEPSTYDLPLKRKLVIEEEDKENLDFHANRNQQQAQRKPLVRYTQEVRERITNKNPSKRKESSEGLRSEVEKKYFRS